MLRFEGERLNCVQTRFVFSKEVKVNGNECWVLTTTSQAHSTNVVVMHFKENRSTLLRVLSSHTRAALSHAKNRKKLSSG